MRLETLFGGRKFPLVELGDCATTDEEEGATLLPLPSEERTAFNVFCSTFT
jgi:hypothetical protein